MQLTMLGGGGFRTPLVYAALQAAPAPPVDRVVLQDVDDRRLRVIRAVLGQLSATGGGPSVRATTSLDDALVGADFVFSAVRVGGLLGRTADERVALDLGVLGQETTGPGGIAYGLRTVPVAIRIASRIRELAPDAWVINFTNPAGMITEAMRQVLGDRVIGICDSPVGLARRAVRALGVQPARVGLGYAGLNHLGWLTSLSLDGRDLLPGLLADEERLQQLEEARLFGSAWLQDLGMIPNEYLYYYYYTRDAIASIAGQPQTRGELLLHQQSAFYAQAAQRPPTALQTWRATLAAREASYMRETRSAGEERDPADMGGYEGVALAVMTAIAGGEPDRLILNVRNGLAIPGLPPDAVVEVPCTVDADGARPLGKVRLPDHAIGLAQQVKAVERLTIQAACTGSESVAREAFALHPLVDSVRVAKALLEGYRHRIPEVDAVFRSARRPA